MVPRHRFTGLAGVLGAVLTLFLSRGCECSINPCSMNPEQLHTWISHLDLPSRHPHTSSYYADRLLKARVDGSVLCMAPPEWLLSTIESPLSFTTEGSDESETCDSEPVCSHECSEEVLEHVSQAINEFNSHDFNTSFKHFLSASTKEGQCCAPFREFSRLFLGPNSPFVRLPAAKQKETISSLEWLMSVNTHPQWIDQIVYALAHAYDRTNDSEQSSQLLKSIIFNDSVDTEVDAEVDMNYHNSLGEGANGLRDGLGAMDADVSVSVVTVATAEKPEVGFLRESAQRAGVDLHVLGHGLTYTGHEMKVKLYRGFLNAPGVSDNDIVVLVDAYDILLFPSIAHIGRTFRSHFDRPIVFSAERSLWPDDGLISVYPKGVKGSDLRFMNAGAVVGYAWALKIMFNHLDGYGSTLKCGPDDQRSFHRFLLTHPKLVTLDYEARMFQSLHFLTHDYTIQSSGQLLMPDQAGEYPTPCLMHGNGGDGKYAFKRLCEGWKRAVSEGVDVTVKPPPFAKGLALYEQGELEAAAEALLEAAYKCEKGEEEQKVTSLYNYGVIQLELGEVMLAKQAFLAVLSMDPAFTKASINMAVILLHEDEPKEAFDVMRKAIELNPGDETAQLTYETIISEAFHGG